MKSLKSYTHHSQTTLSAIGLRPLRICAVASHALPILSVLCKQRTILLVGGLFVVIGIKDHPSLLHINFTVPVYLSLENFCAPFSAPAFSANLHG